MNSGSDVVEHWANLYLGETEFCIERFLSTAGISAYGFCYMTAEKSYFLMNACSCHVKGVLFIWELKLKLQKLYF